MESVIVLVPSLIGGGAERVAINLAEGLTGINDLEVRVLLFGRGNDLKKKWDNLTCEKIVLRKNKLIKIIYLVIFILNNRKKNTVYISHLHKLNLLFCALSYLFKIRVICVEHNTYSKKESTSEFNRSLKEIILNSCEKIVNVSHGAKRDFDLHFPKLVKKSIVLQNPVISDENFYKYKQYKTRHTHNSKKKQDAHGQKVILTVGSLTNQKNHYEFIDIIASLHFEHGLNVKGLIAGDGPLRDDLNRYASAKGLGSRIEFLGFVDNTDRLYSNCDLFLLTSLYEGLPTVLLEAMLHRIQIISANCDSGPAELLTGRNSWRLYELHNIKQANEKIVDLFKNEKMANIEDISYDDNLFRYTIHNASWNYFKTVTC